MRSVTDVWTVLVILGLAVITVVTRSLFFISSKPWQLPHWAQRGLQYAPIAALATVIVPELVMTHGQLMPGWQDARLFAALAGAAWFLTHRAQRQAVLGTIVMGMAVYLPLHLALGWWKPHWAVLGQGFRMAWPCLLLCQCGCSRGGYAHQEIKRV